MAWERQFYGDDVTEFQFVDLNNDGDREFVGLYSDGRVFIYDDNAAGDKWSEAAYAVGAEQFQFVDMNNDGDLEFVGLYGDQLWQFDAGTGWSELTFARGVGNFQFTDADNNGTVEFYGMYGNQFWLYDETGTWVAQVYGDNADEFVMADINGDGDLEYTGIFGNETWHYDANNATNAWERNFSANDALGIQVDDVNNDGTNDLAAQFGTELWVDTDQFGEVFGAAGPLKFWASQNGTNDNGQTLSLTKDDRVLDGNGDKLVELPGAEGTYSSTNGADVIFSGLGTGEVTLAGAGNWNAVKSVKVAGDAGQLSSDALVLNNIVHAHVNLHKSNGETTTTDVDVTVDGSKRGKINTGDGNDDVTLGIATNNAGWSNDFIINTRDGEDKIFIGGASEDAFSGANLITDGRHSDVTINSGKGADDIAVTAPIKNLRVKTGDGDDIYRTFEDFDNEAPEAALEGTRQAVVNTGDGNDTVESDVYLFSHKTIRAGEGDDDVILKAVDSDFARLGHLFSYDVRGGAGFDGIIFESNEGIPPLRIDELNVKGGADNDSISGDISAWGNTTLHGGTGNDLVDIRVLFDEPEENEREISEFVWDINGGEGDDTVNVDTAGDSGNDSLDWLFDISGGKGNDITRVELDHPVRIVVRDTQGDNETDIVLDYGQPPTSSAQDPDADIDVRHGSGKDEVIIQWDWEDTTLPGGYVPIDQSGRIRTGGDDDVIIIGPGNENGADRDIVRWEWDINSGSGNDEIHVTTQGNGSSAAIKAGKGDDEVVVSNIGASGQDGVAIDLGQGNDTFAGGSTNETVTGGKGEDTFTFSAYEFAAGGQYNAGQDIDTLLLHGGINDYQFGAIGGHWYDVYIVPTDQNFEIKNFEFIGFDNGTETTADDQLFSLNDVLNWIVPA